MIEGGSGKRNYYSTLAVKNFFKNYRHNGNCFSNIWMEALKGEKKKVIRGTFASLFGMFCKVGKKIHFLKTHSINHHKDTCSYVQFGNLQSIKTCTHEAEKRLILVEYGMQFFPCCLFRRSSMTNTKHYLHLLRNWAQLRPFPII